MDVYHLHNEHINTKLTEKSSYLQDYMSSEAQLATAAPQHTLPSPASQKASLGRKGKGRFLHLLSRKYFILC